VYIGGFGSGIGSTVRSKGACAAAFVTQAAPNARPNKLTVFFIF
jgi:hypothetical protein